MEITAKTIRDFLDQQQRHITHYIVAHSHYRPYHQTTAAVQRMAQHLRKDMRHARNCFNKLLYGNGAKRKPLLYQPLLIATLEGTTVTTNPQLTLHYNLYLGNLPSTLTSQNIKVLWTYCWVEKAQQSSDIFITQPRPNTQTQLLYYGTKEAQRGNIECWDFENTQIPYQALSID